MVTQNRNALFDLIDRLQAHPEQYDFFRAVRLLQANMPAEAPPVGCSLLPEGG